jgi:hypothetical protein
MHQKYICIRQLSQQINLSVGKTHTMLHNNLHLYPYRITAVQELKPADYPRRLHFCNWPVDNVGNNVLVCIIKCTSSFSFQHKKHI